MNVRTAKPKKSSITEVEKSQVGSAMRELTAQRVALAIICALLFTVMFTYMEPDATNPTAAAVLHGQTQNEVYGSDAVDQARRTALPGLYRYTFVNGTTADYEMDHYAIPNLDPAGLRNKEKMNVTVIGRRGEVTVAMFALRAVVRDDAIFEIVLILFAMLIWFIGVAAFAGPVMILVVYPIERMIKFLGMLMRDPLGYQSACGYRAFEREEDELIAHTMWTKEVLMGMETSFLMSTISRIGSLMKVGFGSAGVGIIRDSLEKTQQDSSDNLINLHTCGSTVSCIFLFCDIRQFTDAIECIQEDVFVFTNKIASVVHSFCNAYGGSANKNVGDAFLISWRLKDDMLCDTSRHDTDFYESYNTPHAGDDRQDLLTSCVRQWGSRSYSDFHETADRYNTSHGKSDKALLSVVKICIALYHDKYFLESMRKEYRDKLLDKLQSRPGPVVQMGFGLHAGQAVQGAIGSQRKIDPAYVSESVEMSDFLESNTKMYGVKILMSDAFHSLLHPSNARRCRKVDQILLRSETDDVDEMELTLYPDIMDLYTYDMDIDRLFIEGTTHEKNEEKYTPQEDVNAPKRRGSLNSDGGPKRMSLTANFMNIRGSKLFGSMSKAEIKALNLSEHTDTFNGGGTTSSPSNSKLKNMPSQMGLLSYSSASMPNLNMESNHPENPTHDEDQMFFNTIPSLTPQPNDDDNVNHHDTKKSAPSKTPSPPPGVTAPSPPTADPPPPPTKSIPELILPTGALTYSINDWNTDDMRKIRQRYTDGLFFQNFHKGLQAFYNRDWEEARMMFQGILDRFEDGPSRYYIRIIEKNHGVPPEGFKAYRKI